MPLHAICSLTACSYAVELQDRGNGVSIATPDACPVCGSMLITCCLDCRFPLVGKLGSAVCDVCGFDLKRDKSPGEVESPDLNSDIRSLSGLSVGWKS